MPSFRDARLLGSDVSRQHVAMLVKCRHNGTVSLGADQPGQKSCWSAPPGLRCGDISSGRPTEGASWVVVDSRSLHPSIGVAALWTRPWKLQLPSQEEDAQCAPWSSPHDAQVHQQRLLAPTGH
jgi:hypothetical protein